MGRMPADQLHAYRLQQASSVKLPYLGLAITLFFLGLLIAKFKLPVIPAVEPHGRVRESVWKYRLLVLCAIGIFVYVGAEAGIGSLWCNYVSPPKLAQVSWQCS